MCDAASFSMVSANSWSLMEGSEIFFTITEWPLTAVATALVLISFSFEIALDTVPESTIMESTTMSEASGSSPRCATSIPARVFLSSTALMLEEPTSRPTIVFDPIPNMCPPFVAPVLPASRFLAPASRRPYRGCFDFSQDKLALDIATLTALPQLCSCVSAAVPLRLTCLPSTGPALTS